MKKLLAVLCSVAMLVGSCSNVFAGGSPTAPTDASGVAEVVVDDDVIANDGNAIIQPDGTAVRQGEVATTPAATQASTPASTTSTSSTPASSSTDSTTSSAASSGSSSAAASTPSTSSSSQSSLGVEEAKASDYPDGSKANAVAKALEDPNATTQSVLAALGISGASITTAGGKTFDISKLTLLSKLLKLNASAGQKLPMKATLPANQSLVGKNKDDIVVAQINVQTGKVDFLDADDLSATGALTVTFPGTGPFLIFEGK
jgi:hypothetical protein